MIRRKSNVQTFYIYLHEGEMVRDVSEDYFQQHKDDGDYNFDKRPSKRNENGIQRMEIIWELVGYCNTVKKTTQTFMHNNQEITVVKLNFTMVDPDFSDERYVIQIGIKSAAATSTMRKLENIDFSKKISFRASLFNEQTFLIPYQWDEGQDKFTAVKKKYDTDDERFPDLREVMIDGETRWDRTERLEFYETILPGIIANCDKAREDRYTKSKNVAENVHATATAQTAEEVDSGDPELEKLLEGVEMEGEPMEESAKLTTSAAKKRGRPRKTNK